MTYATPLTTAQIQTAQSQAQSIANSATTVIGSNKFVFFAAFDGTNNDRSNPLVADPAKGLRSLAAFDANGDGRIDASDPIYDQLKVWQNLDQNKCYELDSCEYILHKGYRPRLLSNHSVNDFTWGMAA